MADTNPNILFKRGLQANLPSNGNAIDGAFYLTTDTNRLYAGIGTNIVDLNKYIRTFTTFAQVQTSWSNPQIGDFAYIQEGNILATYTTFEGKDQWVQINPDTNTDTILSKAEFEKATDSDNKITITLKLTQKDINGEEIETPITTSFELSSEDIASITTDVAVDLEATVDSNGVATVKVGGTGADQTATADTVTIKGSTGVTVKAGGSDTDIVIEGTTYELNTEESTTNGKITLEGSNGETQAVNIIGNDNWIDVTSDGNGNVNIVHTGPGTGSEVTATPTDGVIIAKTSPKLTAVVGVEADTKGHITGVKTTEFTLPDSDFTLGVTEGTLKLSDETDESNYTTQVLLKNSAGNNIGTANIETAHKITVDGDERIVNNGGDLGSFYSASIIDSKFRAVDAMVYGGAVESAADLAEKVSDGVSIGDTFKASKDFTLEDGTSVKVGDILIANVKTGATENEDGLIDSTDISWDHIASGADTDTTYTFTADGNALKLNASTGGSTSVEVAGDSYITATATGNKLTVQHKEVTPSDSTDGGGDITNRKFTAVTDVTRDDAGHVTGVTTGEFTIADMSNKLTFDADTPQFNLADANGATQQSVAFAEGDKINVSGSVNEGTLTIKVDHEELENEVVDTPATAVSVGLDGKSSIQALTGVTVDNYGHITGFQTTTFNVEAESDTTYTYAVDTEDSSESVARLQLKNNNNVENNIDLTSDNLTFTTTTNAVNIDFTWGTF